MTVITWFVWYHSINDISNEEVKLFNNHDDMEKFEKKRMNEGFVTGHDYIWATEGGKRLLEEKYGVIA